MNLKSDESNIKDQIAEQQVLKRDLDKKIRLLDQDGFIEKVARDRLGLVKKGENAYKVIKK